MRSSIPDCQSKSPFRIQQVQAASEGERNTSQQRAYQLSAHSSPRIGNFIAVIDFHASHIYSTCVDSSLFILARIFFFSSSPRRSFLVRPVFY